MDPTSSSLYFCHECNITVTPAAESFTCPQCNGGFIEPIEQERDSNLPEAPPAAFTEMYGRMLVDTMFGHQGPSLGHEDHPGPRPTGARAAPRHPGLPRQGITVRRFGGARGIGPQHPYHQMTIQFPHPAGASGGPHAVGGMADPMSGFFQQILQNAMGGPTGIHFHGMGAGVSNPGDYVHGPEAFDAVITQLLNQMEGTGPPPAPADQIDAIPRVAITQQDVDKNTQCAVCFDNFSVGDNALKLRCDHCYHEDCIKPWLEMHNTCPVCRKDIAGDAQSAQSTSPDPVEIEIDLQNWRTRPRRSSHGDSPPS